MKEIVIVPGTLLYKSYRLSLSVTQTLRARIEGWRMPETTTVCGVVGSVIAAFGTALLYLALTALIVTAFGYAGYVIALSWKFFLALATLIGLAVLARRWYKQRRRYHATGQVSAPGTSATELVRAWMRDKKNRVCTKVRVDRPQSVGRLEWLPDSGAAFGFAILAVLVAFIAFFFHAVIVASTLTYEGPCAIAYEVKGSTLHVTAQCSDMPPARVSTTEDLLLAVHQHSGSLHCTVSDLGILCKMPE